MTARQLLVEQIIRHEGIRLTVYNDTRGVPTIGVGRNLRDKGLSNREVMDLLDHDLDECITDLSGAFPWFLDLNEVRQRAVVDLRFQLGMVGLQKFHRMLAALAKGDFTTAANELLASVLATQTPARTFERAQQIQTGVESHP